MTDLMIRLAEIRRDADAKIPPPGRGIGLAWLLGALLALALGPLLFRGACSPPPF